MIPHVVICDTGHIIGRKVLKSPSTFVCRSPHTNKLAGDPLDHIQRAPVVVSIYTLRFATQKVSRCVIPILYRFSHSNAGADLDQGGPGAVWLNRGRSRRLRSPTFANLGGQA